MFSVEGESNVPMHSCPTGSSGNEGAAVQAACDHEGDARLFHAGGPHQDSSPGIGQAKLLATGSYTCIQSDVHGAFEQLGVYFETGTVAVWQHMCSVHTNQPYSTSHLHTLLAPSRSMPVCCPFAVPGHAVKVGARQHSAGPGDSVEEICAPRPIPHLVSVAVLCVSAPHTRT